MYRRKQTVLLFVCLMATALYFLHSRHDISNTSDGSTPHSPPPPPMATSWQFPLTTASSPDSVAIPMDPSSAVVESGTRSPTRTEMFLNKLNNNEMMESEVVATQLHIEQERRWVAVVNERYGDGPNGLAFSLDESVGSYYEKRDLEAWRMVLESRGYTVQSQKQERPLVPGALERFPSLSFLLCMSMAATDRLCIAPKTHGALPRRFRVNQMPGLRNTVWKKDELCKTLDTSIESAVQALGSDARVGLSRHVIPCWLYPKQASAIAEHFANGGGTVIVKPPTRGEGRGIYTAKSLAEIEAMERDPKFRELLPEADRVVQRMELAPALLWGRKFDLRTYVLITSLQPLRLYLWRDGLVRLAATPYSPSLIAGSSHREAWMTNTFVNKQFADVSNLTVSFARMDEQLSKRGVDTHALWRRVREAIVDTMVLAEPAFTKYVKNELDGKPCVQCFQLLGVDVLIDDRYGARVIEINGLPSMQLSHEQGAAVNKSLRYTATKLDLLGSAVDMVTRGCSLPANPQRDALLKATSELSTDEFEYFVGLMCEHEHANGFARIFPTAEYVDEAGPIRKWLKWSATVVQGATREGERGREEGRDGGGGGGAGGGGGKVSELLTNNDVVRDVLPLLREAGIA